MDVLNDFQIQWMKQWQRQSCYAMLFSMIILIFSIFILTIGEMDYVLIPVGLSIPCFGGSILCGLLSLKYERKTLSVNATLVLIQKGAHPDVGESPRAMKMAYDGMAELLETSSKRSTQFFGWQGNIFYLGIILFTVWQLLELMALFFNGFVPL